MTEIPEWAMEKAREAYASMYPDYPCQNEISIIARALMEAEARGRMAGLEEAAAWHDQRALHLRQLGVFHAESLAIEHERAASHLRNLKGE